jgi:peroxiredoxin family protein/rhodanese-related sulfurtransferase/TusA-related sulfurtransferase
MVPLAGPANKQARICANNILGKSEEYRGTQGTAIAKVFDLTAATVGMNEKQLKSLGQEKGKDYFTALINQKSHAGYYPGATPLNLKMIFDGTGKILGAQAVGQDGIDKRIDVLASAMRLSATVYDLKELELAYAPPFGSAKDPVNMLGFVAENVLEGLVEFVDCGELDRMIEAKEDFTLLDISESEERLVYAIPNSIHIPLGQLRSRFQELDSHKPIVVYCAIGVRSYNAARILKGNGFQKVSTLAGGYSLYKTLHYREWKPNLKTTMPDQIPSVLPREEKEMMILNCAGLQCPGPIMKVNESLKSLEDGQILQVSATDMGFPRDVESWCRRTGNTFLRSERKDKMNIVYIQKGLATESTPAVQTNQNNIPETSSENKTIIVFSGDLDKVLASFIIANGAAAMGRKVTMFFTFWGLNALRKSEKNAIKKPFMDKMFGTMMPRGASKLSLSNMNMGGMGTKMMKMVMKDKNVQSLEELMQQAMANGVHIMACTMSMDIMGITQEELIDGVELGGVATYLGEAEESNVNLFI